MIEPQTLSGESVLVTGGLGAMGRRLSRALAAAGHRTRVLGLPAETGSPAAADLLGQGVEIRPGDITRPETLPAALTGTGTVFHLAAVLLSPLRPEAFREVNVEGTRHLVRAAEAAGVRHFIHVSSVSVRYPWSNAYAESKREAEEIVRSSALPFTILRPTLAYGEGGGAEFHRFVSHLERWPIVPLPQGGRARKSPVHLDDLVAGFLAAMGNARAMGKTYHLAGGDALSLREMGRALLRHMGRPKPIIGFPLWAGMAAAGLASAWSGMTGRETSITRQSLTGLVQDAVPPRDGAGEDLGWRPRSFAAGLESLAGLKDRLRR